MPNRGISTTGIFPKWVNSNGHRRKKKEENTQGTRVGLSSMTERWPLKAEKMPENLFL